MHAFTPNRRRLPDYERVVRHITARVKAGELRPGDQLPSYRELAEEFEVSVSTVQQALRILRVTGVVEGHPGKGTFVARPSVED